MMRNERRQLLDRSLIDLSREMDVDDVLLYLQGKGVFTDAVVDKVLSAGSVSAQRAAIVRVGGDDDVLSVYPVLEALNARNAPLLSGKPKLIFIQACRGAYATLSLTPSRNKAHFTISSKLEDNYEQFFHDFEELLANMLKTCSP
ncbi:hypothetical protein ANCCEY_01805 [Ancylostoma ceylanicum]|uniref:Caspase family p20 domain-containing protein n=1 Tax=Ancylostoma ceylanicum TaxID=53326 RepID=A0A0D6MCK1_9BILA|nr:hypothetical protein ANCCEY_01805 [Ancylostoma ceylanicum]